MARNALAIVVGKPPATVALPAFELAAITLPAELPLTLPSELAHRRPDILAAEAQLHAATAEVGVATSNLYPQITLAASGGLQATDFAHLFDRASNVFGLGGSLVAPLLDGGTLRAEQRAAVAAMHARAAQYEADGADRVRPGRRYAGSPRSRRGAAARADARPGRRAATTST